MRRLTLVISFVVIATVLLFVAVISFYQNEQMKFPKEIRGNFLQLPKLIMEDGVQKLVWIVPEKCSVSGYEAREMGYEPNSGKFWGGGDAECSRADRGYECRALIHDEMRDPSKGLTVQAFAYECEGGESYVSEAMVLRRHFVNNDYGFRLTYPSVLEAHTSGGRSDLMGRFLTVDIGTSEELELLQQASRSSGAGGPPLFLRLTVSSANGNEKLNCGELSHARDIKLGNTTGVQCEGSSMVSDHVMKMIFNIEDRIFIFQSDMYTKAKAIMIDDIVRSFRRLDE